MVAIISKGLKKRNADRKTRVDLKKQRIKELEAKRLDDWDVSGHSATREEFRDV